MSFKKIAVSSSLCTEGPRVTRKLGPGKGTGLGNKGPLKVLNGTKLILDDHGNNLDSFRISLESFRSFRDPLLLKPVTGQELFFVVSYSKPALICILPICSALMVIFFEQSI